MKPANRHITIMKANGAAKEAVTVRLRHWDIAPDGQRVVVVLQDEERPDPEQIVVIPDFTGELRAKFLKAGQ